MIETAPAFRLSAFLFIFAALALGEMLAPRRQLTGSKPPRWFANLSIVLLDTVLVRRLFAGGAVGAAMMAAEQGWGLLNQLPWPNWVEAVLPSSLSTLPSTCSTWCSIRCRSYGASI